MTIRYVIFDWDGTLADTYPVISEAYHQTFVSLGLPPMSYDEIKKITSQLPNKDILGFVFGKQKDDAKKIYYDYIQKNHTAALRPIPFAKELLDFCRNSGLTLFLLSNKTRPYLLAETDQLGFTDYFSKIIAAGDCPEDKPHPLAVHALFDNILPDADSILVIGDGIADYQTARALDNNNKQTLCAIYDPSHRFTETHPSCLLADLRDAITFIQSRIFNYA